MSKTCLILGFFLLIFLSFFPQKTFAAITFQISNDQTQIDQNEELNLRVTLSGLSPKTTYYLQARIKSTSGTKYFGLTQKNDGTWYKYTSSLTPEEIQSQFFSFTSEDDGAWSGTVKAKIDIDDHDYKGSGDYTIQVLRYTGGSSSPTGGASNDIGFTVVDNRPTPTPTSTPTPEPTKAPSPSKRPKEKTTTHIAIDEDITFAPEKNVLAAKVTGSVKKDMTRLPSMIPTSKLEPKASSQPTKKQDKKELLVKDFSDKKEDQDFFPVIFLGIGGVFLLTCGILIFLKLRKQRSSGE